MKSTRFITPLFGGSILFLALFTYRPAFCRPPETTSATQQLSIRDGFFTTDDGIRIHYLCAGRMTAKAPIVFIPGWRLTASLWQEQLQVFSVDRLVIAIDSRSQGDSSVALFGNTPERRARDLHELMARRQISRFVVVGWSQGVQDVAAYVQEYGTASLAAIAFVDSPVSHGAQEIVDHKESSQAALSRLEGYELDPAEYAAGMVRSIFRKPHSESFIQHVISQAEKTPPSIAVAMLATDLFGKDRRPALKEIDCPTLVIASASSPLLETEKEMAESIPGARWFVVPGAGHALFVDDPEVFDDHLALLLKAADRLSS